MGLDNRRANIKNVPHHSSSIHFIFIWVHAYFSLIKKIKTILKNSKRGDILRINWIDAGDINDDSSSWFSEDTAINIFKEIPVETIAVYFGHGKENLFLVRDTEKQDIKVPYYNGACVIPIGCIRSVEKLSN